jgi:hypothetical protein
MVMDVRVSLGLRVNAPVPDTFPEKLISVAAMVNAFVPAATVDPKAAVPPTAFSVEARVSVSASP